MLIEVAAMRSRSSPWPFFSAGRSGAASGAGPWPFCRAGGSGALGAGARSGRPGAFGRATRSRLLSPAAGGVCTGAGAVCGSSTGAGSGGGAGGSTTAVAVAGGSPAIPLVGSAGGALLALVLAFLLGLGIGQYNRFIKIFSAVRSGEMLTRLVSSPAMIGRSKSTISSIGISFERRELLQGCFQSPNTAREILQ